MRVQNNYIVENNTVYLEIINTKGTKIYFIIDKDFMNFAKDKIWYAMYCPKRKMHYLESRDKIKYHRYVTNCSDGMVVDHIDRNTYDNRLINLRICTVAENNNNRYYPTIHKNPKGSNTGINYISYYGNGKGNNYYCVRYKKNRKNFKLLSEAILYLDILKKGENTHE